MSMVGALFTGHLGKAPKVAYDDCPAKIAAEGKELQGVDNS